MSCSLGDHKELDMTEWLTFPTSYIPTTLSISPHGPSLSGAETYLNDGSGQRTNNHYIILSSKISAIVLPEAFLLKLTSLFPEIL